MTHASVDGELHKKIRSFIRARFAAHSIADVLVDERSNDEGDRVLVVTVIFEGPTDTFLDKKPAGLTRYLRNKLLAINESAFPLLSFVSAAEFAS